MGLYRAMAVNKDYQCSVIIVDDNPVNLDVLKRNLETLNCLVATANDGEQAMHLLEVESFDLMLLDIMMPEVDGYEVLRRVKESSALASMPVMMVSAVDDMDSIVQCIGMGAVDYIVKPFESRLLRNRVLRVIERNMQAKGSNIVPVLTSTITKILIVDDSEINRDILQQRLTNYGYQVDMAVDGLEALEKLQQEPFDLILLDIMMPGLDGYETLERVKSDAHLKDIPVVMISALDDREVSKRCIKLGASDYITKPFNSVLLKSRIQSFKAQLLP